MYFNVEATDKDTPTLSKDDAEKYLKCLVEDAARATVYDSYEWRQYASHDVGIPYDQRKDNVDTFWEKASESFKSKVAKVAGKAIHNKLVIGMARNKHLLVVKDKLSVAETRDAVENAIAEETALQQAGKHSSEDYQARTYKSPVEDKEQGVVAIDIGHKNENVRSMTYSDQVKALAEEAANDLMKAFVPKPNVEDFIPKTREELELFRSHGVVPKGFLSRQQVTDIYPSCGEEMTKARMPLIREERFKADIARRVAVDVYNNTKAWAEAIPDDIIEELSKADDAEDYDLTKAKKRAGLVKKTITNKAGKRQVVWVDPDTGDSGKKAPTGTKLASDVETTTDKPGGRVHPISEAALDNAYTSVAVILTTEKPHGYGFTSKQVEACFDGDKGYRRYLEARLGKPGDRYPTPSKIAHELSASIAKGKKVPAGVISKPTSVKAPKLSKKPGKKASKSDKATGDKLLKDFAKQSMDKVRTPIQQDKALNKLISDNPKAFAGKTKLEVADALSDHINTILFAMKSDDPIPITYDTKEDFIDMVKAKKRAGLVKKTITNKAGKKQVVWIDPKKDTGDKKAKKQSHFETVRSEAEREMEDWISTTRARVAKETEAIAGAQKQIGGTKADKFLKKYAKTVVAEDMGVVQKFQGLDKLIADNPKVFVGMSHNDVSRVMEKHIYAALTKKSDDPIPIIGEPLDLVDFIKAHPSQAIKGWAKKMTSEGGDHPHTWCTKKAKDFASDPNAFCAAVHMEAFGCTPVQRKQAKKGVK